MQSAHISHRRSQSPGAVVFDDRPHRFTGAVSIGADHTGWPRLIHPQHTGRGLQYRRLDPALALPSSALSRTSCHTAVRQPGAPDIRSSAARSRRRTPKPPRTCCRNPYLLHSTRSKQPEGCRVEPKDDALFLRISWSGSIFGKKASFGRRRRVDVHGPFHHNVDTRQGIEREQLRRRGGRELRTTASENHNLLDVTTLERRQCVVGDVGASQYVRIGDKNSGHVESDVTVTDHHCTRRR